MQRLRKILPIWGGRGNLQICAGSQPSIHVSPNFKNSFNLVCPESISTVLERLKSIKSFRSYVSTKKRCIKIWGSQLTPYHPRTFFYEDWTYSVVKALRDQYQPNSLGNGMCPFQQNPSILQNCQILDNI